MYLIKFHAIIECNIFGRQYINIINKLDLFINDGVWKRNEDRRVYETVCLIKVYHKI